MHPTLIKKILGENQIFSLFEEKEIQALAEQMHASLKRVDKGSVVIRALDTSEQSSRMYLVLEGALKVALPQADGEQEVVLNVLTSGTSFGELSMFDAQARSASVIAMTDCVVASLRRADFYRLAETHAGMMEKVIRFLCGEVRRLSLRFEQVSTLNVKQRLAAYLLALSKTFKGQPIRMTQQELSSAVGATREQTSRIMTEFYRAGFLEKLEADAVARGEERTKSTPSPKVAGKHAQIKVSSKGETALSAIVKGI